MIFFLSGCHFFFLNLNLQTVKKNDQHYLTLHHYRLIFFRFNPFYILLVHKTMGKFYLLKPVYLKYFLCVRTVYITGFWMCHLVYLVFRSVEYYGNHHHHVVPPARISLTLSRHFSLSFITSDRSSGLFSVSSHSCWKYVLAGRPAFARPYVGVHRSASLMSSSLLLQQCPACLVCLTWIVFVMGGRWPYS